VGQPPPSASGDRTLRRNGNETANRYSPLEQITPANVTTLQRAWGFHLKPAGFTGRFREDEAIPLVIANTMYLGSPYGAIHALDATTGAVKRTFQLPNNDTPSKRGVAYWPGDGKVPASIIFGGLSGGMYSIKASDGTLNAGFGVNGVVNLKTPEPFPVKPPPLVQLTVSRDNLYRGEPELQRQYVTVVSTGGGLTGSETTNDEIIAFALPKK
jgi:glucose dehydrogenase